MNVCAEFKMLYFMFSGEKPNALSEPRGEEETLTKKGKKKKSVRWAEEDHLKEYFYFDLDETERGKTTLSALTLLFISLWFVRFFSPLSLLCSPRLILLDLESTVKQ